MSPIEQQEIARYVEENIPQFHKSRVSTLVKLKLEQILRRKNPYLFRAKNINTAGELVKSLLDAYLSSSEEGLFGNFLEGLALFVCSQTFGGRKSSSEGIDLEFDRDRTRYIISIKSGPNWGNSSQIRKMMDNFNRAVKILRTSNSTINVVAVNGCCYGKDNCPEKGSYVKLCGQRFWEFISGDETLYTKIVEPLGHKAKENTENFEREYGKVINRFTMEFLQKFCDSEGQIVWQRVVELNSSK